MTTKTVTCYTLSETALLRRMAAGECAQDLLEEFVLAAQQPFSLQLDLTNPLHLLVKHGARMATVEQGSVFERLLTVSPSSRSALVFSDIMKDLIATPGEVPLHIMARDSPALVLSFASQGLSDNMKVGLQKRDTRGRTASHWLWASDGLLVEHANQARAAMGSDPFSEDALAKLWMGTLRVVWRAQQLLHDHGAGLDIPDHDGITAMQLCLARIEAEDALLFPGQDICRQVKAYQHSQEMEAATLQASATARGLRF